MSVPRLIRDELKRCRADPARIVPLNSLENLNVNTAAAIEELGRRYDARDHADVMITSRIMLFNEYFAGHFKLELQRHVDVVVGIEALYDNTGTLELDFGHFMLPFIGSKAPVVIPIIALQFSQVKIRLVPALHDLHPAAEKPIRVIGCMLKGELRRQLCRDKIYCEQDNTSEDLAIFHNLPILNLDIGYNGIRFPSPSKFFDDDPSIDWFDPKQRCWHLLRSYGPHLRDLARLHSKELGDFSRRKRQLTKRIDAWFHSHI
jgi:hypothetical protein